MSNSKKTGLGRSAFFNRPEEEQEREQTQTTPPPAEEKKPEKPKKVRTTVTLYPETLASMETLKVEARREQGRKVTYSDVLQEAIELLMNHKGLSP